MLKTCQCCGFTTFQLKKRVCPSCKVPALWVKREETTEEKAARSAKLERLNAIAEALLNGDYD